MVTVPQLATDHRAGVLAELRETGVALVRDAFAVQSLLPLEAAAQACFAAIREGGGEATAKRYRFTPFSYSVQA